jgi:heterodisulfide reductase subunit B
VHLLEVLRERIGWEVLAAKVSRPLLGWKIAPYYGCTLLRPQGIGIDEPDAPTILGELIETLMAEPVEFPFQTECCGSYQIVDRPELAIDMSGRVLRSARRSGADLVVTSCPLCAFNLRTSAERLAGIAPDTERVPVLYFTQLLALGLGLEAEVPMEVMDRLEADQQPA